MSVHYWPPVKPGWVLVNIVAALLRLRPVIILFLTQMSLVLLPLVLSSPTPRAWSPLPPSLVPFSRRLRLLTPPRSLQSLRRRLRPWRSMVHPLLDRPFSHTLWAHCLILPVPSPIRVPVIWVVWFSWFRRLLQLSTIFSWRRDLSIWLLLRSWPLSWKPLVCRWPSHGGVLERTH